MPPKKRTRFGGNKSNSPRNRILSANQQASRNMESEENRFRRLEADRVAHRVTRAEETEEQRSIRLEADRLAHGVARSEESQDQRTARLEADRSFHAVARSEESQERRTARLEADRSFHAVARSEESQERRTARLEADRSAHTLMRAEEPEEERNTRLEALRTRRVARPSSIEGAAFLYSAISAAAISERFDIGRMEHACPYCGALKWSGETKGLCCCNGKISLPVLQTPPEPLKCLMSNVTDASKHFLKSIRSYNSAFQMTSFGSTAIVAEPNFMPTFKVQGQVYHRIGSMLPVENERHQFLQIYFIGDEQKQAEHRCSIIPGTREDIILQLQSFLNTNNNYVRSFKTALDRMLTDDFKVVIEADRTPAGEHERRFNSPLINEVAVVIAGNEFNTRDIVLQKKDNRLQHVCETHRSYDALQYPLIFWQGEDGYHFEIKQIDPTTGIPSTKKVSAMNFYSYRLMVRQNSFNLILRCRRLFLQFVVDMFAKIESERLLYVKLNQNKLRADEYIHLRDAMNNDGNSTGVGQLVILPSSFTGSPRHMHEYTQDAMTYVKNYGRPDLFITFTCNPSWPEIQAELMEGQKQFDRHDLTARVFRQKLIQFLNSLTKLHIFGKVRCWMYTVEWQKRGLPHAHILLWLTNKIVSNDVDKIISAEIPDPQEDPVLFAVIVKNMIHGPCGVINPRSPCMKNGKCTKNYPRNLIKETQTGMDGYPLYRRRSPEDGGRVTKIKVKVENSYKELEIDNKWVVPYCPLLSRLFQAHINVEYCSSVKSIKYICKYVNKGSDQAVFSFQQDGSVINEIEKYQMGRYISSNEAVWRIFSFPIHERFPSVLHLSVHLENGQRVYFTEENVHQRIMHPPKTTLTAFFELCQNDDFARTLLYCELPKYYTWNPSQKVFMRRKQGVPVHGHPGIRATEHLGRVYTVHPTNFECFYLRILLHTVTGPTSFEYLRVVDGVVCQTFREACLKRGLLEDDTHWNATMLEASTTKSPKSLRILFAIIVAYCGIADPMNLWNSHKESLSEDIRFQAQMLVSGADVQYTPEIFNQALIIIEDKVLEMIGKRIQDIGLPTPDRNHNTITTEMIREKSYSIEELRIYISQNEPLLTDDQKAAYTTILEEIPKKRGKIFFLDAPGGTGKTFLIKLLLAKIREDSKIALAVASSGIAATLLPGGRTAHSAFKLPLNMARSETPICNIAKQSEKAQVLQECQMIVWDECTMSHKNALQALNQTLQFLRSNDFLMGGVTVVLAGDFRQTLPVIPKGTMADEINACLKSSHLWKYVRTLRLTTNMRVHLHGNTSHGQFADYLLNVGNGLVPLHPVTGLFKLEENLCKSVMSLEDLKEKVFPNVAQHFSDHKWLCERAILAPKNDSVNSINLKIQDELPGEAVLYKSIDTVAEENDAVHYPTEFLNSLEPPGMPPHNLVLKIGAIIMLLRNLNPPSLCNGTRLIVKKLHPHFIEATILTGCAKGEDSFIPRIPLIPSDMPFQFKRLQIPVRLAFAMTVNKAQGQSLNIAGVNLESPCFSHGQFYVACSRVGSPKNLFIFAPNQETKNIVYGAALN